MRFDDILKKDHVRDNPVVKAMREDHKDVARQLKAYTPGSLSDIFSSVAGR